MTDGIEAERWPSLDLGTRVIRLFAWLMKAKYTHGAMVMVRNDEGELLLVQERLRERGSWGLPGGFMRMRETPRRAAVRELREEVGLNIAESDLAALAEYQQPWAWHYDHVFALSCDTAGMPGGRSVELRGHAWFAPDQLPPLTRAAEYALHRAEVAAVVDQSSER